MGVKLQIVLSKPNGYKYTRLETVSGEVHVSNNGKPVKIERLLICFVGKESVKWKAPTLGGTVLGVLTLSSPELSTYSDSITFIDKTAQLIGKSVLSTGTFTWPFTIQIPAGSPSSYNSPDFDKCYILYEIKAELVTCSMLKWNAGDSVMLNVAGYLDLDTTWPPEFNVLTRKPPLLTFETEEGVGISVQLQSTRLVVGTQVSFLVVAYKRHQKFKWSPVLQLCQIEWVQTRGGDASKVDKTAVVELEKDDDEVGAKRTRFEWYGSFQVPGNLPLTNLGGANLICLEYCLLISDYRQEFEKVRVPVIVGSRCSAQPPMPTPMPTHSARAQDVHVYDNGPEDNQIHEKVHNDKEHNRSKKGASYLDMEYVF